MSLAFSRQINSLDVNLPTHSKFMKGWFFMKYYIVIYSVTCLKNTAYNWAGDIVTRASCIFARNYAEAQEKFLSRYKKSIKHNPVDIHIILPVDVLCRVFKLY